MSPKSAQLHDEKVVTPQHGIRLVDRGTALCYCGKFSWVGPSVIQAHAAEMAVFPPGSTASEEATVTEQAGEDDRNDEETPMDRFRTLVRVVEGVDDALTVVLTVPAWRPSEDFRVSLDVLPDHLRSLAVAGARFHARANLAATSSRDLAFDGWEDR